MRRFLSRAAVHTVSFLLAVIFLPHLALGQVTFTPAPGVPLPVSVSGTVPGDFANNKTQDIAAVSGTSVYIFSNDGTGTLTLSHTYTLQQPSYGIATADVNHDGNLDLVVAGTDPIMQLWNYSVLLGNGDGSFQPPVFYSQNLVASESHSIVIADFNNDHKPDLAISMGLPGTVAVLLGNGDGTFAAPVYFYDGGSSYIVGADFNGDGNADLAASGPNGIALLLGNGDGTFQPATFPATCPSECTSILSGDVNGDGKPDLITTGQVFLGKGDGTFTVLSQPQIGLPDALADVNGDGKIDVLSDSFMGSHGKATSVSLGVGDGSFDSPISVVTSNNVTGPMWFLIATADMNGDGKQDLIFAGTAQLAAAQQAVVFLNTTPRVPGTPTLAWAIPTAIPYGTPLSATQLNATANAPGTFVYTPPAGSVLSPGTQSLSVTFTPTDTIDYTTATKTVSLTVTAATYTITPSAMSVSLNHSGSQPVTVTLASTTFVGTMAWTATTSSPLIQVSPSSGTATLSAGSSSTVNLTIGATKSAAKRTQRLPWTGAQIVFAALLVGIPLAGRRKRVVAVLLIAFLIATLGFMVACGGGSRSTTPLASQRSYTVTISGTGGVSSTIAVIVN
jgi:hypothetical protein